MENENQFPSLYNLMDHKSCAIHFYALYSENIYMLELVLKQVVNVFILQKSICNIITGLQKNGTEEKGSDTFRKVHKKRNFL